ncbi:acyl-CoA-binding domain-containing protein 4 [Elaeis guineensis]|uniref:Acyl-CoA-binding domain-containing protein 4 n=1 Tax=Elaeis guineensis var. tenera TaxID=51953 RepID=A0A6J0PQ07_ELAGV|nr:acyl-CoA-binding domain-containing protein 4 [Elaeis guineensis]XP_019709728.1 acyl-CoA-binding domain-containing protein 4 [Elaeis guineensis]XP_019709729.1 acyl-CoA-binding domain-containing protein 4 [Elaeis guineensis]XP_019709730.1 acyl-CoA-binding domain-containing protein 4 [Elaeis guineensis]
MGDKEVTGESDITALLSSAPYDQWILIHSSGWCPPARYKHAAEVVQEKLYVVGGSRNGRYLSDIQVFDLRTFKWSTLSPKLEPKSSNLENITSEETFPASAGHSLVKWENKLLVVAGYSKEPLDTVTVWSIDLETHYYSVVPTNGKIPTARGGQSVTLVGSKLIMFGGEDRRRKLLNDLHILDLKTMTWDILEAKKIYPAPRFDHIAAVHADQYLLIFGGSSHSTCFNDLHLLDLHSMEWSRPETQGTYVTPRGGHAGATVDESWYIVGGGDNQSGATDTIVLNTSKFVWSVATSVKQRDPLASEGLTLCSTTIDGEKLLIAFGGYNGKYNNEVFVLKHKPRDSIRPRLLQSPAAAAAAASVTAAYAVITATDDKNIYTTTIKSNIKGAQAERSPEVVAVDTHAISAEKKMLESRLVEVRDENSRLQASLDEMNNSHTELLKELKSVQGQLAAESARCMKLEAQIAVMQNRLEALRSIEHELEVLRHQKSQMEQDMAAAQRKPSGGVWQWMTSSAQNFEE